MKRRAFCVVGLSLVAVGTSGLLRPLQGAGGTGKSTLSTLSIYCCRSTSTSITLKICAGVTGAPAGFSLQWMTADDYAANNCEWSDLACAASFSGNAKNSRYRLAAGSCVQVTVGNFLFDNGASTDCELPLDPDTAYVFRAFAHSNSQVKKSEWSDTIECETLSGIMPPPPPS